MLRAIIVVALVLNAAIWLPAITRKPPKVEDSFCPAKQVMIRYPAWLADYHDGPKGMEHYRIAYCKPTGRDWR